MLLPVPSDELSAEWHQSTIVFRSWSSVQTQSPCAKANCSTKAKWKPCRLRTAATADNGTLWTDAQRHIGAVYQLRVGAAIWPEPLDAMILPAGIADLRGELEQFFLAQKIRMHGRA